MFRQSISRIREQMTGKKLCGLRSVPSLFRVSPIWSAFCRPVRRGHYKETALLYGRVAGHFTWSVNARSLRSLALGSVVSLRSPPSALRSLRSFSAAALPALATLRPPAFGRATSARSSARSARLFLRFTPKKKRYFREKRAFRGTHIFPENVMFGFFSVSTTKKHESKQILYITSL